MCNADVFPGTSFDWFYPQPISLLTQRNVPLSALLNAERYECLSHDLVLLLFFRGRFGELLEYNSSSARVSTSSGTMGSFPLSRAIECLACSLSCKSSLLGLHIFSTWARKRSFSRCRCSAQSSNSLICLACFSCFFSMS